jgi:hypothetical protein
MRSAHFLTLLMLTDAHAVRAGRDLAPASENGYRYQEREIRFATGRRVPKVLSHSELRRLEFSPALRQLLRVKIQRVENFADYLPRCCERLRPLWQAINRRKCVWICGTENGFCPAQRVH